MNNQISESIFSNGRITVPMMDVSHIEHINSAQGPNGVFLIMKDTRYDMNADTWANAVFLYESEKQDFLSAWCRFRSEYEASQAGLSRAKIATIAFQALISSSIEKPKYISREEFFAHEAVNYADALLSVLSTSSNQVSTRQ